MNHKINSSNNRDEINLIKSLIWIDMEMTGLNPEKDHILEMAMVITDQNLNVISNVFNIIINQPEKNLILMNDVVKNMHNNNGLLDLVQYSHIDLAMAEQLALDFVNKYSAKQTSPMCGNSICLDRRFLFKFMPKLEAHFHYRNLDVSTIKNLSFYWFPAKAENFKKHDDCHRAAQDVLQSIEELKFYKNNIFIQQDEDN